MCSRLHGVPSLVPITMVEGFVVPEQALGYI